MRARLGRWIAKGLVVALLAAGPAEMRAEGRWRPLDHHAVVLNGDLVGSAFLLDDDLAVTNRHVVRSLRPGAVVLLLASGAGGGQAEARVIAISPRMDLALLRVPRGFIPKVAAEDAKLVAGLEVTAAGIDAGVDGAGQRLSVQGVVLDPSKDIAAFGPGLVAWLPGARPGFSGGPMLDGRGRLVGMVTAIRPAEFHPATAAAGKSGEAQLAIEAFALRADDIRAEVRRLLAAAGR